MKKSSDIKGQPIVVYRNAGNGLYTVLNVNASSLGNWGILVIDYII